MTLAEEIKAMEAKASKEGISESGGNFFKFQEGDNKFRVLTKPTMVFKAGKELGYAICFTGCGYTGRPRFMCYVLDRKDGRVKLAEFPMTIGQAIAGYETDEEYAFQGYPLPYDIKVTAVGAGTKEVDYTVVPGRANSEVPQEIIDELAKKDGIEMIIAREKEEAKKKHGLPVIQAEPETTYEKARNPEDINPEDIPF